MPSALGIKNAGLHHYVVSLTGTMTCLAMRSFTTLFASFSNLRGTLLDVVILNGFQLSTRDICIFPPVCIGTGFSSSLIISVYAFIISD